MAVTTAVFRRHRTRWVFRHGDPVRCRWQDHSRTAVSIDKRSSNDDSPDEPAPQTSESTHL